MRFFGIGRGKAEAHSSMLTAAESVEQTVLKSPRPDATVPAIPVAEAMPVPTAPSVAPELPQASSTAPKAATFISYSRKDAPLAERLLTALKDAGLDAYLDRHDIAPGELWENRLGQLIAASDAVIFVLSPNSAASRVCRREVAQARSLSKRILPLLYRDVASNQVPEELSALNYVYCRDDREFSAAIGQLFSAIMIDIAWLREQTRIGLLAHNWNTKNRREDDLLRGEALLAAEAWMTRCADAAPDRLIKDYLERSRTIFDIDERERRSIVANAFSAESNYLAKLSIERLAMNDPSTALYLALESLPDPASRFEERRSRPLVPNSVKALKACIDHLQQLAFLPPDRRRFDSMWPNPGGGIFCGVKETSITLLSQHNGFSALATHDCGAGVHDIAFSADSFRLAALISDGTVMLFTVPDLKLDRVIEAPSGSVAVALDWGGTTILFKGANGDVLGQDIGAGTTFDLAAGGDAHSSRARAAAGHFETRKRSRNLCERRPAVRVVPAGRPGSRYLAHSVWQDRWLEHAPEGVALRSLADDELVVTLPIQPDASVHGAAFCSNPDLVAVAVANGAGTTWMIYNLNGVSITTIGTQQQARPGDRVNGYFARDGQRFVTVSGKIVSFWDPKTGKLESTFILPQGLNSYSVRPDLVASAGTINGWIGFALEDDSPSGTPQLERNQALLLNASNPERHWRLGGFDGDGAYGMGWGEFPCYVAVFGHSNNVYVHALNDIGPALRDPWVFRHAGTRMDDGVRSADFFGAQLVTASVDGTARLWDIDLQAPIRTYRHGQGQHLTGVRRAKFSCDSEFIFTLDDAGLLRVFTRDSDEPVLVHDIAELAPADIWGIRKSGTIYVVTMSGALVRVETPLGVDAMWRQGIEMLPAALSTEQRVQLGITKNIPDWCARYRKWPFLAGDYTTEVRSEGHAVSIVRDVTVLPAAAEFRSLIAAFGQDDAASLARLAMAICDNYSGIVTTLAPKYRFGGGSHRELALLAEIFEVLLQIADEVQRPDLAAAMGALYRGPVTERMGL